jgi:hypothetical protein
VIEIAYSQKRLERCISYSDLINRHYHKPINTIFIDTRQEWVDYSIINTAYRYAPTLRLDVGRMLGYKYMTDIEAVSNYRE